MQIKVPNTDKLFFSKPYAKYNSVVTHFTSRKSTAIEWMILELIKRYSSDNEYANISLKKLIEEIIFITDSDILVKPSIIELIENINAIEIEDKNNSIYENTSLDEVYLSNLSLTEHGREFHDTGMLPATENQDTAVFIYDKLENDLRLENNIGAGDLKKECKGIKLSSENDFIFDENRARGILEEEKDKDGFKWLKPTSDIKSINIGYRPIQTLWKYLSYEMEIGEDGKLELKDEDKETNEDKDKYKEICNKLLIENIDNLFKKSENIETKEFQSFDYGNFQNLTNIFSADSISNSLKNILNNKDFVIVNDNFSELINYETITTNLLLI